MITIYTSPLSTVIRQRKLMCHLYANDNMPISFSSLRLTISAMSFMIFEQDLLIPSSIHFNAILYVNLESSLTYFKHTNIDEVNILLSKMNKTTCMFDPFPTRLLLDFFHLFIEVIVCIINLTFSTAPFPVVFKSAVVKQLLKNYT